MVDFHPLNIVLSSAPEPFKYRNFNAASSPTINPHAQPMPNHEFGKRVAWQGARRQGSVIAGDACLWPPARPTSATQVARGTDNGHAGAGFQGLGQASSAPNQRLTQTVMAA